jgi:Xaa-Pro aminopeptidase
MASAQFLTNLINIQYLTGFKSSHAVLVTTSSQNYLFTDGRYIEKAEKIAAAKQSRLQPLNAILLDSQFGESFSKIMKKHRIDSLEFEADHLTVSRLKAYKKLTKGTSIKWKANQRDTETQRAQKDSTEIKKLKKSQAINEAVFHALPPLLKPGITEVQVAQAIKRLAHEHGADDISFEPIVAFDSHSSMPHHENTTQKLKKGAMVLIDMGMLFQGYASDMTRVLFTKTPTAEQEKIYNLVLNAQISAIEAMQVDMKCADASKVARLLFKEAELEDKFTHSLGHGIGMEVHEAPNVSIRSTQTFKAGMVVTSEPGLYLPGKFGVRIEDMILITPKGPENLTKVPKSIPDCIIK